MYDEMPTVTDEAVIGLVGKYTDLHDTYLSVVKALLHASLHCKRKLTVKWIDSSALDKAKQHKVKRVTILVPVPVSVPSPHCTHVWRTKHRCRSSGLSLQTRYRVAWYTVFSH